jgi:hypothetical protein
MTTLLTTTAAVASTATEGDVKNLLTNLRAYIADLLGTDSANKGAALALLGAALNGSVAKTGAYTVVAADRGKVISCNGTFTLTVQAAATLGDGFVFGVLNAGSGTITIDPNISEQIDGQLTKVIGVGGGLTLIYCNGTSFSTVSGSGGGGMQVFKTAGSHTFTVPPGVTCVKVTAIGGGGSGGNATTLALGSSAAGGGGSGGKIVASVTGLTPGASIAVTVGAAGAASSFGAHATANAGGNGGSSGNNASGAGGAGGTGSGSGGFFVLNGRAGTAGDVSIPIAGVGAISTDHPYGSGGNGAVRSGATAGTTAGSAGSSGLVLVEW